MDISIETFLKGFRARWKIFPATIVTMWLMGGLYLVFAETLYLATADAVYLNPGHSAAGSQSGGIASLAGSIGIAVPTNNDRQIAIAIMKSRRLEADFIGATGLLPILFPERWNSQRRTWAVKPDQIPTLDMGVNRLRSMMSISDNTDNGVITVSLTMSRKDIVAPLVDKFVAMADSTLRQRALKESMDSLQYLEGQLTSASITELRNVITDLAERNLQQMTLVRNSGPYAFEVIDPAVPPLQSVWPRPLLLFAILTMLGLAAAMVASVLLDIRKAGQVT